MGATATLLQGEPTIPLERKTFRTKIVEHCVTTPADGFSVGLRGVYACGAGLAEVSSGLSEAVCDRRC